MSNLYVSETFVDATRRCQFGSTDPYETRYASIGELYRAMRAEYGRCTGRMYIDTPDGGARAIGWVFQSRQRFDDARGRYSDRVGRRVYDDTDYYIREVWVTVHTAPPTHTVTYHHASL